MARHNQGGWVATFLIVGTLLLLGVLGGVYYIRTLNQGEDSKSSETAKNTEDKGNTESSSKKDEASKNSSTTQPSGTNSGTQSKSSDPVVIPQTGPTDGLYGASVAAILVFSILHFARSKRPLQYRL